MGKFTDKKVKQKKSKCVLYSEGETAVSSLHLCFTPKLISVSLDAALHSRIRFLVQVMSERDSCNSWAHLCQYKNSQVFLLFWYIGDRMEDIFPLPSDDNTLRQCRLRWRKWLSCVLWRVCFSFSHFHHWTFWKYCEKYSPNLKGVWGVVDIFKFHILEIQLTHSFRAAKWVRYD